MKISEGLGLSASVFGVAEFRVLLGSFPGDLCLTWRSMTVIQRSIGRGSGRVIVF